MDVVHGSRSSVGWEGRASLHGATEQGTEVLVQVRNEEVLVGCSAVGWLVHEERSSSTVIEEVDGDTGASTTVGRLKSTSEVWCKVDGGAVVGSLGQDTWDGDADVWLSV